MVTSPPQELHLGSPSDEQGPAADRGWFLLDCAWHDAIWILRPTNVLEERRPVRLVWGFSMPDDRLFTDDRYASLLESSRQLIAVIRRRTLSTGLSQRASTVAGYFSYLRQLLQWMDRAGVSCFADLDPGALRQFQRSIAAREGFGRRHHRPRHGAKVPLSVHVSLQVSQRHRRWTPLRPLSRTQCRRGRRLARGRHSILAVHAGRRRHAAHQQCHRPRHRRGERHSASTTRLRRGCRFGRGARLLQRCLHQRGGARAAAGRSQHPRHRPITDNGS